MSGRIVSPDYACCWVKYGKGGACNQKSSDNQAIDCLLCLEFHDASEYYIFIRFFPIDFPAVGDCVQHCHIKPCKYRHIKKL